VIAGFESFRVEHQSGGRYRRQSARDDHLDGSRFPGGFGSFDGEDWGASQRQFQINVPVYTPQFYLSATVMFTVARRQSDFVLTAAYQRPDVQKKLQFGPCKGN